MWWWVWLVSVAAGAGSGVQGSLPPSRRFNIGGVLHDNDTELHFTNALKNINFDGVSVADQTTLYDVTLVHRGSPIAAALHVCQTVIAQAVFAVVVASSSDDSVTTASVSYTCGFYHIPVICTHSRDYIFSDKNIHVSLLRTVPPYSHQADVWVRLLKLLGYRQVIVLHSTDTDGRALLARFQSAARHSDNEKGVKVVTVMEFSPGQESFVKELTTIREELVKVVLLYASEEDAEIIFHDASYLNMTNENYVWLVTEQALRARLVPVGALGLQLKYADDYNAHIIDSLRVVALALRRLHEAHEVIPEPPISCDDENSWDETGRELFSLIRGQVLTDGSTGKVAFDEHGDRIHAEYSVVNVQERRQDHLAYRMPQVVGEFLYDAASDEMVMQLNKSSIRWAGGLTEAPPGYFLPRHLKVLTIRETPFVYAEAVKDESQCSLHDEVFCPMLTGKEGETRPMCCWGFCIDLLLTLAEKNAFSFSLFLAPDGQYGDLVEGPDGRNWTGMIGHLAGDGDADMAVAPLTINPQRSQDIHLTKPFKYQGITILVKRAPVVPALVSILQPFRGTLWLLLMATVHVIAILIWLLDRLSPVYRRMEVIHPAFTSPLTVKTSSASDLSLHCVLIISFYGQQGMDNISSQEGSVGQQCNNSPPMKDRKARTTFTGQTKDMVMRVYEHFCKADVFISKTDIDAKTMAAKRISRSSLQHIEKEVQEGATSSPPAKKSRVAPITEEANNFANDCF